MEKTTDLEVIRKNPTLFTWGVIQEIYDVGPYTVVESVDRRLRKNEVSYHCYVDGWSLSRSALTLESAFLICFAHKLLGEEQQTDYMAQAAYKLLTP